MNTKQWFPMLEAELCEHYYSFKNLLVFGQVVPELLPQTSPLFEAFVASFLTSSGINGGMRDEANDLTWPICERHD
jgi:hypothetical protein